MTTDYAYISLHNMECEPHERLFAAIIYQAFSDYVLNCRVILGERKPDTDYHENPWFELSRIRTFLLACDSSGRLVDDLGEYVRMRGTTDMHNKHTGTRAG